MTAAREWVASANCCYCHYYYYCCYSAERSGMQDPLNRCIALEHGQSVQVLPVVFLTNHEASFWEALCTVTHNPFRLFVQRLSLWLHHSFSVFVTRPKLSTTMQPFFSGRPPSK